MHEAMARYQYVYALKPIGRHRNFADDLFRPLRTKCERCEGLGIISISEKKWRGCVECEGTGSFWSCSQEEVARAREMVLERYPEASASNAPANFIGSAIGHDLSSNEMVDLRPESPKVRGRDAASLEEQVQELCERIVEDGRPVYQLEWDSGGPGAGAGIEAVYEYEGKFVYSSMDLGRHGPYESLLETIEGHGSLTFISNATVEVTCALLSTQQLLDLFEPFGEELKIHVNGSAWCYSYGKWTEVSEGEQ